ncbi:MAG: hypothetical protein ACHQT7_00750 [Candidatus Levyibacteriota bacterium]
MKNPERTYFLPVRTEKWGLAGDVLVAEITPNLSRNHRPLKIPEVVYPEPKPSRKTTKDIPMDQGRIIRVSAAGFST